MKLYELTEAYKNIYDLEDDSLTETLDTIQGAIEEKAVNMAYVIKNIDGDIDAIDKEINRLQERKKSAKNKQTRLKNYLKDSMEQIGMEKLSTPIFNFNIQKNPPALIVEDESKIDDKYFIVEKTLDKKAIKEAIKQGAEIEGVSLKQSESLRIR